MHAKGRKKSAFVTSKTVYRSDGSVAMKQTYPAPQPKPPTPRPDARPSSTNGIQTGPSVH